MEIRNEFSKLSEEIRSLERASHECDLNAEKIKRDSQDSKINRQGYLSEAEIYLKQLEKDGHDIKTLLNEITTEDTEETILNKLQKLNIQLKGLARLI